MGFFVFEYTAKNSVFKHLLETNSGTVPESQKSVPNLGL